MVVTRTLYHVHKEEWKISFERMFDETIRMGTRQQNEECPLSMIRELPEALQSIFEFAVPVPDEKCYYFKVRLKTCVGTEAVFVEALDTSTRGGPNAVGSLRSPDGIASLSSMPIGGKQFDLLKPFLREHAGTQNQDGTYLNEGQLRVLIPSPP